MGRLGIVLWKEQVQIVKYLYFLIPYLVLQKVPFFMGETHIREDEQLSNFAEPHVLHMGEKKVRYL